MASVIIAKVKERRDEEKGIKALLMRGEAEEF